MRPLLNLDALPALVAAARAVGVPLDGHTLGMIGEAHAARLLGLTLLTHSTAGHDALDDDGRTVEIKATTGRTVYLRPHVPDLVAVLRLDLDTLAGSVIYFGPAAPVWALAGPLQKNGTHAVSVARIATLGAKSDRA